VTAGAAPGELSVARAEPNERPLIEGLFQFYIYDFSEFEPAGSDRFDLDAEARFDPYPMLDQYWSDATCIPLLIRVGGKLAGFALINAFAHSGETTDRGMAEFFILRKFRRSGLGAAAAGEILRRYPGRWEIAIARRNLPAIAFWPRVVGGLAFVRELKTLDMDEDLWRGPVLQFVVGA
jgi:predicted acetyltransferase